jgi:hypothetical protein
MKTLKAASRLDVVLELSALTFDEGCTIIAVKQSRPIKTPNMNNLVSFLMCRTPAC